MTGNSSPEMTAAQQLVLERRTKKMLWISLFAVIALAITLGVALIIGGDTNGSTAQLRDDRLTRMERTGETKQMLEAHQSMMEQMRAGLSPEMQQRMDADPMWKLMRTGEFARMMEEQQQAIDRMLGKGSP